MGCGEGAEKGAVPPENFFFDFGSQYGEFLCILDGIFYSSAIPVLHAKPEFNRYMRIKAVMVSNSARPWSLHSLRTLRLGWTKMCSFIIQHLDGRNQIVMWITVLQNITYCWP